jgi:hypothetical protein
MTTTKRIDPKLARQLEEEKKKERKTALGMFDDVIDDEIDEKSEEQKMSDMQREIDIEHDLFERPVRVHRFSIRPLTLSAFALLRHAGSAFLTFTPLLSDEDRDLLIALSRKKQRADVEETKYIKLLALAKAENEMVKNPYLETLTFMAIMTSDTDEIDAADLVFSDDARALRIAALEFGNYVEGGEMEILTGAIGAAVSNAQKYKVVPKKKGERHTKAKRR